MSNVIHPSLPIPDEQWRRRWLVVPAAWDVLHRVGAIAWDEDLCVVGGRGTTVCGIEAHLSMPGILSRMELPRCPTCCELLGIPEGNGAPYNAGNVPWREA